MFEFNIFFLNTLLLKHTSSINNPFNASFNQINSIKNIGENDINFTIYLLYEFNYKNTNFSGAG